MYSVKEEFVKNKSICRGCLCTDRNVQLLKTNVDIFFCLLGNQQKLCDTKVLLCWECRALLCRIQSFQNRIQQAQLILQESLYDWNVLCDTNLSTLTKAKKDFYDRTIEYEEKTIECAEKIIEHEKVAEQELESNSGLDIKEIDINNLLIKQELNEDHDDLYAELKLEDDYSITSIDQDFQKLDKEAKRNSIKKYISKAKIIKTDIDLSDTKKHYTKVYLSENEIEDLLERDKRNSSYENMRHKCTECKNAYKRRVDLKRHVTFNHMDSLKSAKCLVCKVTYRNLVALKQHWRRHNAYYKCSLCGWLARYSTPMTTHHRRAHSAIYTCTVCDASCRTPREFSNHYKESHERIICDHCGKSFLKKRTLETHIKRHHAPATCHVCNRTYSHYNVLENHYRLNHPHLIRGDTNTELAYCVECDKQFPSVYKYKRHLNSAAKHTPPKPVRVPCPECGKVFARKIRMTNHYRAVHINDSKHRCDMCNKLFSSAYAARTHRQCVHEKIPLPKNKMCDICGRGFSTNRILNNHRRTHTGERPYKCSHCPATFAQKTAMKTHEKTQHKNTLVMELHV